MLRLLSVLLILAWAPAAAGLTSTLLATWPEGDWHDPSVWDTDPLFPDNGNGGFDYDVVIPEDGGVILSADVTVDSLDLEARVELSGGAFLTVEDSLASSYFSFHGDGTLVTLGTVDHNGFMGLTDATWVNSGDAVLFEQFPTNQNDDLELRFDSGAVVNEGTLTVNSNMKIEALSGRVGSFENLGVLRVTAGATSFEGAVDFIHSGRIEVGATLILETAHFLDLGGVFSLSGAVPGGAAGGGVTGRGNLQLPAPLARFEGNGGIGSVDVGGVVSPGVDGPGYMRISRRTNFLATSELRVDVGGEASAVQSDFLENPSNEINLGGNLVVTFVNGYEGVVQGGDRVVILQAETGRGIHGEFENVAPDGRLTDTMGNVEFTVRYGAAAPNPDVVVLRDFVVLDPPPPPPPPRRACGLLGAPAALLPLLWLRRRRERG